MRASEAFFWIYGVITMTIGFVCQWKLFNSKERIAGLTFWAILGVCACLNMGMEARKDEIGKLRKELDSVSAYVAKSFTHQMSLRAWITVKL